MKILHIIDSGGLYGAEVMLLNLVAEQIKLGLQPTIASIGEKSIKEKRLETEALKKGFRVEKFRMIPGPNIAGALNILRFAHREKFNLLHSHGYKGNVLFGFMPKRVRKLPLVATLHGWTSTDGFSKNRLYETFDALSLRFIDAVVLVNRGMLNLPKLKNAHGIKFHIVNNGIPIPEAQFNDSTNQPFKQSGTQQTQLTQQTQVTQATQITQITPKGLDPMILDFCKRGYTVGSIGRLSTEKGYRYLIDALRLLIKDGIDARLVIIGEGYEREYLERLVHECGLSERVLLPGYRDQARHYIPFFKVFVLSSLTEGLPITLLEAMLAEIPIIATRAGGIPEALNNGNAGILVEPYNADALKEAILLLLKNKRLGEQVAFNAKHRVMSEYSSTKMAKEYRNIYENAVRQC